MKPLQTHPPRSAVDPSSEAVDRRSHEPAYLQICNILKNQIARGSYLPGSRLPSEAELCRHHRVSPMTVRRSIKALIDQGIVTTVQGSGTFVKAPDLGRLTFSLEEFHNLFKDQRRTRVRLLEARIVKADQESADHLQVDPGARIILLRRLLVSDGDPIVYHREFLVYDPAQPIVEAELEMTNLHGLFVGSGQSFLKRGEFNIEAVILNQREADLLNTMPLQPAFRLEHRFYDVAEKPVSWGQFICRGDRLRFRTTVGIGGGT